MAQSPTLSGPTALQAAEFVRQHHGNEVLPDPLAKKLGIERWQAVTILKELADAGYGTFIVGRRGGETRLVKSENSRLAAAPDATSGDGISPCIDKQVYLLRRSPRTLIEVPADITAAEANLLGKWLELIAND